MSNSFERMLGGATFMAESWGSVPVLVGDGAVSGEVLASVWDDEVAGVDGSDGESRVRRLRCLVDGGACVAVLGRGVAVGDVVVVGGLEYSVLVVRADGAGIGGLVELELEREVRVAGFADGGDRGR